MIIIEGNKGEWYCINPGETYITEDMKELTYERVIEWMHNGELHEHGLKSPTIKNDFERSRNNGNAMRYINNLTNVACMATRV